MQVVMMREGHGSLAHPKALYLIAVAGRCLPLLGLWYLHFRL